MKIAHLNVRSLKSREHFHLIKDTMAQNGLDIFTISETWLDATVTDESIEIPGFQVFRQDLGPLKSGGGLCTYVKTSLKASMIEELSSVSINGFQQVWLKEECKAYKSLLVCNVYRAKPCYITARSCTNYNMEQFCKDLALVPFHIMSVFDDSDDQVNTFNTLFTDILDAHAPLKRTKIKTRPNPFVTPEIRQLMKTCYKWHKKGIKTNDCLCWSAFKFVRQEVKWEL